MKDKIEGILSYLDELYPDARCELSYTKDYELLIATVLSAQCTDKRVNEVTKVLWENYDILFSATHTIFYQYNVSYLLHYKPLLLKLLKQVLH